MTLQIRQLIYCDGKQCLKVLTIIGDNNNDMHIVIGENKWQTVLNKVILHYCPECYPIEKAKFENQPGTDIPENSKQ